MTLEEAIQQFPSFLLSTLLGLVKAALTEAEVLLLVVFGVLIGILVSPLWGFAAALSIYLVFRMVSQVAALFAQKADRLVEVMVTENAAEQLGFDMMAPPVGTWTPEEDGARGSVQPEGHRGVGQSLPEDRGGSAEVDLLGSVSEHG